MNISRVSALHEILSNKIWWMEPSALHASKDLILSNIQNHTEIGMSDKVMSSSEIVEVQYTDEYTKRPVSAGLHLITYAGPVLRNSDACTMGSIDFKEYMMDAADNPNVNAHIITINSPGGSAMAIYDFCEAIMYARSKNQPVIAFVRGLAASAGYALAMLCDKIICYGEHDLVGCIGAMAAFLYNKSGDQNRITQERYVELYAEKSPLKNKEARAIGEDDFAPLKQLIDESAEEFLTMIDEHRPQVAEEHRQGDTYYAKDVIGSLVDGIGTFRDCIEIALDMYNDNVRAQRKAQLPPN